MFHTIPIRGTPRTPSCLNLSSRVPLHLTQSPELEGPTPPEPESPPECPVCRPSHLRCPVAYSTDTSLGKAFLISGPCKVFPANVGLQPCHPRVFVTLVILQPRLQKCPVTFTIVKLYPGL